MLDSVAADVLERLREATQQGQLVWTSEGDYFLATLGPGDQKILIRRIYMEATNQIGADPYFVELHMPGWNARFAITEDSEGWRAIRAILDTAFPEGWASDARRAKDFLDRHLSKQPYDDVSGHSG